VYEVRQMCKGLPGKGDHWKEEDEEGGRGAFQNRH